MKPTVLLPAFLATLVMLPASATAQSSAPTVTFEPYEFVAGDGTKVQAERGVFQVPENRNAPGSRLIELGMVRFKATGPNPGAPIIYLAGGPGGSGVGTAQGRRFPLFMAMREFGDVIAFDQRGTGWSNPIPQCTTDIRFPLDQPLTIERSMPLMRQAADECAAFWRSKGVDLAGYNTAESARDIGALRVALEVPKLSLWGISYGSHLAFAVLKAMPGKIDRVVLAGLEGPDHTIKLPANTDGYFVRLQGAIDADPEAKAAYPDLVGLMRRVHTQLDAAPMTATVPDRAGNPVSMTIGKTEMQLVASSMIADPATAARLPKFYSLVAAGELGQVAPLIYQSLRRDPIVMRGMPEAMDVMSGISAARLALVRQQARTSLLGDMLNFPMPHLIGTLGVTPLGDDFRAPVQTDVPTLFLTGTLDGRTYPEGAAEILKGFSRATQVIVENGGHNVYMQAPQISDIVLRFMRGEVVPSKVTLDPPKFLR